jgi:hypothetical protein
MIACMKEKAVEILAVDLNRASAMCSLSRRTLENYVKVGRLRARKVGRRTLVLVRDLEQFLGHNQPSPIVGTADAQADR